MGRGLVSAPPAPFLVPSYAAAHPLHRPVCLGGGENPRLPFERPLPKTTPGALALEQRWGQVCGCLKRGRRGGLRGWGGPLGCK